MSSDSDDSFICFERSESSVDTGSESSSETSFESATSFSDSNDETNTEDFKILFKKKVRFTAKPVVHMMISWSFAYRHARKGNWEEQARDNARFQRRIENAALYLNPILTKEHRLNIFSSRFANNL